MNWPISIKIEISAKSFPAISLVLGVLPFIIGALMNKHELVSLGVTLIILSLVFTVLFIVLER